VKESDIEILKLANALGVITATQENWSGIQRLVADGLLKRLETSDRFNRYELTAAGKRRL
jgi:hypothetical protein